MAKNNRRCQFEDGYSNKDKQFAKELVSSSKNLSKSADSLSKHRLIPLYLAIRFLFGTLSKPAIIFFDVILIKFRRDNELVGTYRFGIDDAQSMKPYAHHKTLKKRCAYETGHQFGKKSGKIK